VNQYFESVASFILVLTSAALVWGILRLRQRRAISGKFNEGTYTGRARKPEELIEPDDDALEHMGELLDWHGHSEE